MNADEVDFVVAKMAVKIELNFSNENPIVLEEGDVVFVNPSEGIAKTSGQYFEIFDFEYRLLVS